MLKLVIFLSTGGKWIEITKKVKKKKNSKCSIKISYLQSRTIEIHF